MMKLKHLPLAHRAEKWTRFSAPNDALIKEGSIGWLPKVQIHFWVRCSLLAGCLLVGSAAESVYAQSRMDRDWDRGQDWQDRDWRGGDRDRDWDRGRRWRDRDRGQDCYTVRREYRDRFGDIIVRRYRVCDD